MRVSSKVTRALYINGALQEVNKPTNNFEKMTHFSSSLLSKSWGKFRCFSEKNVYHIATSHLLVGNHVVSRNDPN